jgi:hypothetical protein
MDDVKKPLRYAKFTKKKSNGERSQVLIVTSAMDLSIKTVYKIMKARRYRGFAIDTLMSTFKESCADTD